MIRILKCCQEGELYGITPVNISACLHGKRNQHKGFQFILFSNYNSSLNYKWKRQASQNKAVQQFDLLGNFIMEFKSLSEASKHYNIKAKGISKCVLQERKTYKGFVWKEKI